MFRSKALQKKVHGYEMQISQLQREVEETKSSCYELISNVSHEIKTPLAAIVAMMDNAVSGVTKFTPALGNQVLDHTEKLSRLVSFLLDLSCLNAGSKKLNYREVDIDSWLFSVIEPIQMLEAQKNLTFAIAVSPNSLTGFFDPVYLSQAMTNIISNAIRYAADDSEIVVEAYISAGELIITAFNEGEQITVENQQEIFKRFNTSAVSGASSTGGTGLGLAIVRWVTDLHHGSIQAVDPRTFGQTKPGAMFVLKIPADLADAPHAIRGKTPRAPRSDVQ